MEIVPRKELPPYMGRRKRPQHAPRDVLVELSGWAADPHFVAVSAVVRAYRTKFGGLMRVLTASVSHAAAYDARHPPSDNAPTWRCALHVDGLPVPLQEWSRTGVASTPAELAAAVESYLLKDFLGWKMLRQIGVDAEHARQQGENHHHGHRAEGSSQPVVDRDSNDVPHADPAASSSSSVRDREHALHRADLIVRPFITETARTAGYLVASRSSRKAIVIDPGLLDAAAIAAEIKAEGLTLTTIIVTHVPRDHALGVVDLLHDIAVTMGTSPPPRVVLPVASACTEDCSEYLPHVLGDGFSVVTTGARAPWCSATGFQDHETSQSVVLSARTAASSDGGDLPFVAVAAFTGVAMGLDCPGPTWLPNLATASCPGPVFVTAVKRIRQAMRRLLIPAVDSTVLLPAYGGYNNSTHQLDLAWAAHLGDVRRATPNLFRVLGPLLPEGDDSVTPLVDFCAALLGLVKAPLFGPVHDANKRFLLDNKRDGVPISLFQRLRGEVKQLNFADMAHVGSPGAVVDPTVPLVLDLRMSLLLAHRQRRPIARFAHCLAIPMGHDVPLSSSKAKRAELWTATQLLPNQPVVLVVDAAADVPAATERLRFVTCGLVPINGFITTEDLERVATSESLKHPHVVTAPDDGIRTFAEVEAAVKTHDASACEVVDVRAPYEFRNGSHATSQLLPLSDMRLLVVRWLRSLAKAGGGGADDNCWPAAPEAAEAAVFDHLLRDGDETAASPAPGGIALYCAGGYRSFIALTMLASAQHARATLLGVAAEDAARRFARLLDVPGGALQIMTKHADHWVVKDRNVICIS